MQVKVIYKNGRYSRDRKKYSSLYSGIEMRSGVDQRKLDKSLKLMIERNIKDQNKNKQTPTQPGSSSVVRRRKGKRSDLLSINPL